MSKPAPRLSIGATKPDTHTRPSVGNKTCAITFKSVLLPAPLAPIIPIDSPDPTDSDRSFNAQKSTYLFCPRNQRKICSLKVVDDFRAFDIAPIYYPVE